ncbi:MAG: RdgB/HAM1 family non-canonical purine NTP pyrophosphatase [Verrucomicrobia bacterium]|nr:RdgB/HAM1 family non-canonical purine NTP pyrophosphatase [Verrucomicrobiota bacterium]
MKLYLASGNAHKVQEFQALADASSLAIEIVSAKSVGGMPMVIEDAGTFIGNATKKARALKAILPADAWVLADDSGLCVDALDGAPGVESAYYAGPQGDSAANLAKLVRTMRDVPSEKRTAHFICVLVLIDGEGQERVFEGRCDGHLLSEPRGGTGFGYDPLFVPDGQEKSLAEIDEALKNQLSHRGRAWKCYTRWRSVCS